MDLAGIGSSVEGVHAVTAAVAAGRVQRLVVEERRRADLGSLLAAGRDAGAAVEIVDRLEGAATAAPQGVMAVARPIPWASLAEAEAASDPPAVVVFDHWHDSRNVGAAVRSAVAAGVRGFAVAGRRAAPLQAAAFKAAAGALERAAVARVSSIPAVLRRLHDDGLWIVGLDASAPDRLWDCKLLAEPCAVVAGSEGAGLGRLAGERCDVAVSIPLAPGMESLNASVAMSLAVFELARRRGV